MTRSRPRGNDAHRRRTRPRAAGIALVSAGAWAFAAAAADTLSWPPTLAELNRIGRTIAEQKCPRPIEVKSSFVPNPQRRDAADEMRSIDCREFRIAVYVSASGAVPRESPMELVIERAHPRLDPRLGVGSTAAAVRAVLGTPPVVRGESLAYPLGPRDSLIFEVLAGEVRAVTWSWDVE